THVRSRDPRAQPAIRLNSLADPIDQQAMPAGFRMMRKIVDATPMDGYRGEEFSPGATVQSDEEILTWIRNNSQTAYHPIGTCRMGPGPNAVVDDKLKVHGLEGLRVADASIFPTMPSGNTNAPSDRRDGYRGEEFSPGATVQSDEEILTWIRNNSQTAYHPIGTCRMGPGPNAVVDDKLKVHGLEGLRVADASIFPTMPSGNTNAP